MTYDFGGWCWFFMCGGGCDNTSGTFPASTGSDYIQTYVLTNSDFDTYITTPTGDGSYTKGYEVEAALDGASLAPTGVDYFNIPQCAEDGSTAGLWVCQQYQPATMQDADGRPRFNKYRKVQWWSITGFIDQSDSTYDDFASLIWQTNNNIWTGASALTSTLAAVTAITLAISA